MKWHICVPALFLGFTLAASPLLGDELLDAAKKEKARREAIDKKKGKTSSKAPTVLSNETLKRSGGTVSEVGTKTPDGEPTAPGVAKPAAKDDTATAAQGAIKDAEKAVHDARSRVSELEAKLAEMRRQAANQADPNRRIQADTEGRQTEKELSQAQASVKSAEADLDRARNDARKSGVDPGSLR